MKYFLFFSLFFVFMIPESCKKENDCACSVDHPEKNIVWMKDFLAGAVAVDVYKLYFEGAEYIIMSPPPGYYHPKWVFDCEGNFQCKDGGENPSGNTCYLPSTFWDTFYKQRVLIYQHRKNP